VVPQKSIHLRLSTIRAIANVEEDQAQGSRDVLLKILYISAHQDGEFPHYRHAFIILNAYYEGATHNPAAHFCRQFGKHPLSTIDRNRLISYPH
jgi:hypothetical protein